MNREYRTFEFELRAEQSEKHGDYITGTPIVFDQETDMGFYSEKIDRDALKETDLKDVRFLVGHDFTMIPLARSRNNNENSTMQMSITDRGMEIRVDLDTENNADARALYSATKRGDISGMSFAFIVDKDTWEDIDTDKPKRTIMSIRRVFEVSAVAFPAYEGTDLQAASDGSALDSVRASLESARRKAAEDREAQAAKERRRALLERLNTITEGGKAE